MPDDEDGETPLPAGQAETTIAVDATGMHVVIGYNDTRGFPVNPATTVTSLSGYLYSDDGGATFTDGGQLPIVSNGTFNGQLYPQIYGDPTVVYLGGANFVYASIFVEGFTGAPPNFTGAAQTICVHRSTDYGHTWAGPFEVPPATNPTGVVVSNSARDAADKELMDADPETGRVLLAWSSLTVGSVIPGGVEISTTLSDDVMTATPPTWSTRQ
ncbi:MAG TPA: sialidase family protein, partial [Thermoanaerobaculia bacterium]|nr:sialidase family protein [Thermoanaerobaculia bacterium]